MATARGQTAPGHKRIIPDFILTSWSNNKLSPLDAAYLALLGALASAAVSLGAERFPALLRYASFLFLGISGAAAVVAGVGVLLSGVVYTAELPLGLPWLNWHLRLDALSGFFLAVVGILVFAVSLYGPAYVRAFVHTRAQQSLTALGVFTALFVLGMQLVVLADDAYVFMVAWELMSVASYFLVAYQHQHAANRRAAFLYLLMAHVAGVSILLGFGVLAGFGGGFTFEKMRAAELSATWASIAFALAFFGFGMKAGMVPVHAWLPEAHPAAPSHISALMSGVMLKVALYGLIRFVYDLVGDIQWQWGLVMLLTGAGSTLLGVLYAMLSNNLKRLLAYSSIENVGIILSALGLSLIFLGNGHQVLGVLGLIAALYHILGHTLFKGLLFLGAGAIAHSAHEYELNNMGGLIHRMPQTAVLMLIGCLAIAGLPPLTGFVSEWLTFQVALQAPALQSGVLRALIPVTAAMLALSAALAAATFVKVYGVAFLGQPRSRHVRHAREVSLGMRLGMGLLAALCVLFGILPSTVIDVIGAVPQLLLGAMPPSATASGWLWLTPMSATVASYSAPLVAAALLGVGALVYLALRVRAGQVRRGYPWECGYGEVNSRMQYTGTAFAQPIQRIFAPVWDLEEEIVEKRRAQQPQMVESIRHQLSAQDKSWSRVYEPIGMLVIAAARRIGYLQTGSIHTYLAYSFFTLLLLLWVVT
jgi:formate hydrogenlyase subunit 3/multisubunit Na+/H+ antiporter MnhD subunit